MAMSSSKLGRLSKTDVRFLSRNFVMRERHEVLHGIELVARYFEVNPHEFEAAFNLQNSQGERHLYTIDNVLIVLESLFPESFASLKEGFFRMLAFDAFIGAPDRHAMNWRFSRSVYAPFSNIDLAERDSMGPSSDRSEGIGYVFGGTLGRLWRCGA